MSMHNNKTCIIWVKYAKRIFQGFKADPFLRTSISYFRVKEMLNPLQLTTVCNESAARGDISEENVLQWREQGYLLVDNLFPREFVDATLSEIKELTMSKQGTNDFEVGDGKTFPTGLSCLDSLSLDAGLVRAVKKLLGSDEVRMSQAETWKKVATGGVADPTYSNQDQRMHMDFPNHTLLHPPEWENPEAVAIIIYLSDCDECGGPTRVVPRLSAHQNDELYVWPYSNMPGFGEVPWTNDRHTTESILQDTQPAMAAFREKLYAREQSITYSPGTVLFYRHDLWHRGTPLLPGGVRYVQNLVFKKPQCDWLNNWNKGTAYNMYARNQYVEKLIARLSVEQRNCLGIPLPGHAYWTPATLEAVRQRYEAFGFDVEPYRAAL